MIFGEALRFEGSSWHCMVFCLAGLCDEPGGHPKPKTDLQAGSARCRRFVLSQLSKCPNPLLIHLYCKFYILLLFFNVFCDVSIQSMVLQCSMYSVFSSLWAGALEFLNSKEPCNICRNCTEPCDHVCLQNQVG